MKIEQELKHLENSSVELTIKVKKTDAKNKYDEILKKYSKDLQLPGFRKGKVPVSILENKYGESLKAETGSDLIEDAMKEFFETADRYTQPLAYDKPELLGDINFDPQKDFSFTVKYDVFPKLELKTLEGFTIEEPEITGEDEALKEALKEVQMRNAMVMDKKSGAYVEKDDVVTVNYCELNDDDSEIEGSQRQDFVFTVGSEMNIYKFDDDIIGMKKDEEKIITKSFDKNYDNSDLAGNTKKIKVKITALKTRDIPALDDDFAQDVNEKFKTLDDLKKHLMDDIKSSINRKVESVKKENLLQQIIDSNPFVLPASMLNAEINSRWSRLAQQMGMTAEKLENILKDNNGPMSKKSFFEENKTHAEKVLKERVIIETLIEEKNPTVSGEDIDNEYKKVAEVSNMSVEDAKKQYEQQHYHEYLVDSLKEKVLFVELFSKSTIKKGEKISVKDFFAENAEA